MSAFRAASSQRLSSSSHWEQNIAPDPHEGVRRVTIAQLRSAKERNSQFWVDGHLLGKFILVSNARTSDIVQSKRRVTYSFDDGSGRVAGYKRQGHTGYPTFRPFEYVFLVGELRKTDASVAVKVIYIRCLLDPHEIFFHISHVVFDTLRYGNGERSSQGRILIDADSDNEDEESPLENVTTGVERISLAEGGDTYVEEGSSTPMNQDLSQAEVDVIACIQDQRADMETHGYSAHYQGIDIGIIAIELKQFYPQFEAIEIWNVVEALLAKGILRAVDISHVDLA